MPVRYMAISKVGGSQGLTKKAEELTMIFISCLLRYSGNLISSQFSYFTSWKNGKQFDCCCCQAALIHFDRQGKKPKPIISFHPTVHRQLEHRYIWLHNHLQQPRTLTCSPQHWLHSPTMCLWLHFTSDTKISPRNQVQTAFPSLAAADKQHALQLYRDFLNQIKSLCAETRAALLCSAGKTSSEKQPALKDFKEWPKPSNYSLGKNYFGNQPKPLWSINMVLKAWSTRNSHAGMQPVWQSNVQM